MLGLCGTALAAILLALTLPLLAPERADAQCWRHLKAAVVERSLNQALRCNDAYLRYGSDVECAQYPMPACAGTLLEDAQALAYGPRSLPDSSLDRALLSDQLSCQRRITSGILAYLLEAYPAVIRGGDPDAVAAEARRLLDELLPRCNISVAEDANGWVLPAVGPQCAAAIPEPGGVVNATALRDCLHTLLRVWTDRFGPAPQPPRPNIVFILTDDQRWDTTDARHSPFGTDVMPLTRAELGGSGVEFTHAFVTTPVCCPSRVSILMGQYAHNTGIHSNVPPGGGAELFDDRSTLATWLKAAGYRTGFYGKYMNGYSRLWDPDLGETPYVPPDWDEWHALRLGAYTNYTLVRNGAAHDHEAQVFGEADEDYATDVLRKLAVEFIDSSANQGQPFFLYLNFNAPHHPAEPAPRHVGAFDGIAQWRPPSFNEPDVTDKPTWLQNRPLLNPAEILAIDRGRKSELEMLLAVDEAIGGAELFGTRSLMQALRDHGIADDTIVVYFSDNGRMWGEHRLPQKNCPYEECIRSPMFVRYPRLAPLPRTEDGLVLNVDIGPTLAALAGVTPPVAVDGQSFERLLDGTAPTWRSDVLNEAYRVHRVYASVREVRWKYTEVIADSDTLALDIELYDLVSDPYELDNVAGDPNHAARVAAMAARLRELRPGWPADGIGTVVDPAE
jgi:N-acetylglucosamine-6-sulfatase